MPLSYLAFMIIIMLIAIPMWKLGKKFGSYPYWKFCIPIYNLALLCDFVQLSRKYLLFILLSAVVPFLGLPPQISNLVLTFFFFGYLSYKLAKKMGKQEVLWFVIGGILFFIPLLVFAFDSSSPKKTYEEDNQ